MTLELAARAFEVLLGWSLLLQSLEQLRVQALDRVSDWAIQRDEVPSFPGWLPPLLDRLFQPGPYRAMLVLRALLAVALGLSTSAALAGGQHAGGHHNPAIGEPGVASRVTRTIDVEAADTMRFTPANITVKRGETVRFRIRNSGQLPHEFSLGTEKDLLDHYEVMKKFPEMEHDEPGKVSLAPGKQGEILWQFTKAGTVNFACLMPGHYEAGMKGAVKVGKQ